MSPPIFPTAAQTCRRRRCEHCGQPIPHGQLQAALVPDSSAVDFAEPARHGQRLVYACGDEHMTEIVREARTGWVDEQWWFELLSQASRHPSLQDAPLSRIARNARLTPQQLAAALAWNNGRPAPRTRLPGGQDLEAIPSPRNSGRPVRRPR
ncbi:hypothetical protein [Amycolatopsis benzoatilytica]|uniref:hypothetical protein n=1 Tax=Amycolatopsis benzoatilytica TaxID=346045 RepID=UPI000365CC9D|nr:hypothetical protein [Amycolatopsis benzoatilytica]